MNLTINDILIATKGQVKKKNNEKITYISTSSKDIKINTLFIPLIGEVFDGHNFMMDAYNSGCRIFLIDKNHEFNKEDISLIEVEDTSKALLDIATYYRNKFDINYVAVTGSVGKTSTKDIIYSVLSTKYKTLKNEGNLNNEIGLPKTLFNLDDTYQAAVVEMGLSYKGDIDRLARIVKPYVAVISNIGTSHIENFGSIEKIFEAKLEITNYFDSNGILVVNGDDEYLKTLKSKNLNYKVITYGFNDYNDMVCLDYSIKDEKISFRCKYKNRLFDVVIPTNAKHNIYNSMSAIVVGDILNIDDDLIIKGLSNFNITSGRLTIKKYDKLTVIDDSYNASCDSMISALNVVGLYKKSKRRVAILGDILECGSFAKELHTKVGEHIISNVDYLITVGSSSLYIKDKAILNGFNKDNIISFSDVDELLKNIDKLIKIDDVILVKASHGIHLERIVEYLDGVYKS